MFSKFQDFLLVVVLFYSIYRIGFGEIGHKLVLEINISDVIGRLGPLYIKAAPGKLLKEQPVKIGFTSQSVSSFPDNLFASSHL